MSGCAISVKSEQEIWLIGGSGSNANALNRILCFNVKEHTFKTLNFQLKIGRFGHNCAFIPNTNKIMITGGESMGQRLDSIEILDTEDGHISMGNPMNCERSKHGMGIVTINGQDKLAVFGVYRGLQCPDKKMGILKYQIERPKI